jgi:hypothetical protein
MKVYWTLEARARLLDIQTYIAVLTKGSPSSYYTIVATIAPTRGTAARGSPTP